MTKDDECLKYLTEKITITIEDMIFHDNLTNTQDKQEKYRSSLRKDNDKIIVNFKTRSLGHLFEEEKILSITNKIEIYLCELFNLKIIENSIKADKTVKLVLG